MKNVKIIREIKNFRIKKDDQKPTDKVEPKFRVGDVVCDKSCTTLDKGAQPNYEIVDIRNGLYICDKGYIPISYQDEYELVAKKIESKFKVGDWVVWDSKISCHIDKIYQGKEYLMYTITDDHNMTRSYGVKGFDNNAHLWTIQDAKEGDVLAEDSCIFIIEKLNPNGTAIVHCCLFDDGEIDLTNLTLGFDVDSTHPATKEQRDILSAKMKEAGYEWDAKKKELKKIELKPIVNILNKENQQVQQEDLIMKPSLNTEQKWSEEDKKTLQGIIDEIAANKSDAPEYDIETYDRFLTWLKSLRPQKQWKPSEKQMEALKEACDEHWEPDGLDPLYTLYQELKKLREE